MYWRSIKSISDLVVFPFPPLLDYILLPVAHPPPRVTLSHFLPNPRKFLPSYLNIPWTTFLFHHLRQITCNPSRDLFTLWGNTRGYTSINHLSNISEWMPASLEFADTYYLVVRDSTLKVSRDVPNDPIPRSTGTAFAYV